MKKALFYTLMAVLLCSCGTTTADEYINLGNGFYKQGNHKKANEYYEQAAKIYEEQGDFTNARKMYEKSNNQAKINEFNLKAAKWYENNKDYKGALLYYEKLGDTAKINEIYLKLAQDYENSQKYQKAAFYYEKLGNVTKINEMTLKTAKWYEGAEGYKEAILYYEKLGNTAKVNEMYLKLAQSYESKKKYQKALTYYQKLGNITKIDEMYLLMAQKQFANSDIDSVNNALDICKNITSDKMYKQCISKGALKQAENCNNGDKLSCSNAGALYNYHLNDIQKSLYYHHIGYDKDDRHNLDSFVQVLEKGCAKGGKKDCFRLGWIRSNDDGYINYSKAIQVYTKACNLNHYTACNNLGVLYQKSYAVKLLDNKKSLELYTKACKGGEMIACSNIGGMYEQGKAVKRNYNTAKSYYKKACVGGYEKACGFYNNLEANIINVDSSDGFHILR